MAGLVSPARDRTAGEGEDSPAPARWRSIPELLEAQAARHAQGEAIAAPGRAPLSYGQLLARVRNVIATLGALGIRRNDRVAIVLPNGPDLAIAFLGVSSGATAAPLNPAYTADEFEFFLADLGARALIVEEGSRSAVLEVARTRNLAIIELATDPESEVGGFALTGARGADQMVPPFAGPDDIALVLHTSGTTSRPKLVPLTQLNLATSAQNVRAALDLGFADRCLNVMPLFHIHGLVAAVLASLAAGGTVICTPGFYAPQFFGWMEECRPTWYTAVPTMHQAILARASQHRDIIQRGHLRFIRSSSAALPGQVFADLEEWFKVPVIEAYGMTEAAHQMASNPLPPRRRKPGSVGLAAGPEVGIMAASGALLEPGQQGEVVIRGRNVMRAYENNPSANAAAFSDGWFRTGDQGSIDEEGYLVLTGRLKEIINRGGEKISPTEIEEVLLSHPAVAQAVVFALPDPALGEDVGAVIVLRDGSTATATDLRDFAAARLVDFKVPREVLFRDEIPKGPTGKLQRIGLAQRLGVEAAPLREPAVALDATSPRTPLERRLAGLWAEVLKVEPPGIHAHFLDLGGDSMLAALLVSRIREELSLELSIRSLFDAPTVADQAAVIAGAFSQPVDDPEQGGVRVG